MVSLVEQQVERMQDAIEPLRRMCKWIVDETCDPQTVKPIWE